MINGGAIKLLQIVGAMLDHSSDMIGSLPIWRKLSMLCGLASTCLSMDKISWPKLLHLHSSIEVVGHALLVYSDPDLGSIPNHLRR